MILIIYTSQRLGEENVKVLLCSLLTALGSCPRMDAWVFPIVFCKVLKKWATVMKALSWEVVISNAFCLKVPNDHVSVCLQHFSAKCHKYPMAPQSHLGSVKWNAVREFRPFLWLEALLSDRLFRLTIHSSLNKGFTFDSSRGQRLRKMQQLQFLSSDHWLRFLQEVQHKAAADACTFCDHSSWEDFPAYWFYFCKPMRCCRWVDLFLIALRSGANIWTSLHLILVQPV